MRQWIHYTTANKPFWDRNAEILDDLSGLKNKGNEKFSGGGKTYPETDGCVVTFEKDNVFYALVDSDTPNMDPEFKARTVPSVDIPALLTTLGFPVTGLDENLEPIFEGQYFKEIRPPQTPHRTRDGMTRYHPHTQTGGKYSRVAPEKQ